MLKFQSITVKRPKTRVNTNWLNLSIEDPMHAYMGVAGMSLMGLEDLEPLQPALNISKRAAAHLERLHRSWDLSNNTVDAANGSGES